MAQYITYGSWTVSSISGASITNGSNATTGSINANNQMGTQFTVALTFSATYNTAARLDVINEGNGVDEVDQNLASFSISGAASSPGHLIRFLPAFDYPNFKLRVVNDSGGTVTGVTVSTRHPVVDAS